MDRLRTCIEALRVVAKSNQLDPFLVIEMRINEFVRAEGGGLTPIERLLEAIELEEARNQEGEDWTIAKEYARSLLERLD